MIQLIGGTPPQGVTASPDGQHIAFTLNDGRSTRGLLWIMYVDTHEFHALQSPFIPRLPFVATWSPDSRVIAAAGFPSGVSFRCNDKNLPVAEADSCQYQRVKIYTEEIASGEMHQIATGLRPTWSPDGSRLALLAMSNSSPEVWTIRSDGSNLQRVKADGQQKWSYFARVIKSL